MITIYDGYNPWLVIVIYGFTVFPQFLPMLRDAACQIRGGCLARAVSAEMDGV